MTRSSHKSETHRRRNTAVVIVVATVVVVAVTAVVWWRQERDVVDAADAGMLEIPLGVEEAAIIRYSGPDLMARPYRRGASVNVRIARTLQQADVRVYDVRYVVSLPGEFELREYLTAVDGAALDGLPSFRVRGVTRLTKDMETRIFEIEEVPIDIDHWYYESLALLTVLWIVWLAGLIVAGASSQRAAPSHIVATPPPLEQRIDRLLRHMQEEELSVAQKAELEVLLLMYWKQQSGGDGRLAEVCQRLQDHPKYGEAYAALQLWAHAPASQVDVERLVAMCQPSKRERQEVSL